MDGCALSMGAGALACAIAEQLDDEELAVMAAFVTVLGDALALTFAVNLPGLALGDLYGNGQGKTYDPLAW